jgi:hypothetical protein
MWKIDIPKICHIYWGGRKLIYLRYLTVKTFIKLNPDWRVILWYPVREFKGVSWGINCSYEKKCRDYSVDLLNLPIEKQPIDFGQLRFGENTAEVHKADYTRISVMGMYGGVWSDLDVIYFKPMDELRANTEENNGKEVYVCIGDYGHSTGFIMASAGSHFFSKLSEYATHEYRPGNYQCLGPDIFNKYFPTLKSIPNSVNLSMDIVYAHNCHRVNELLNGSKARFTDESIGCHWYAGNNLWADFLDKTCGGETNLPDNIIGNLIKNV